MSNNPFNLGYVGTDNELGSFLKKIKKATQKISKPVSKAVKKVSQKTLGKSTTAKLSKVVQSPAFKVIAGGLATAGVGAMLAKTSIVGKVAGAANSAKKVSTASKAVKAVVKTKKGIDAVKKGAKIAKKAAKSPAAQAIAKEMLERGATPEQVEQAWIDSDAYKAATSEAIKQTLGQPIAQQLQSQGVPASQIPQAVDYAVAQATENAVQEQQNSSTLGKAALIGIPIIFALMGGA